MIWFYLAGFISGAAGVMMYAHYWIKRHTVTIKLQPLNENEEDEAHE